MNSLLQVLDSPEHNPRQRSRSLHAGSTCEGLDCYTGELSFLKVNSLPLVNLQHGIG